MRLITYNEHYEIFVMNMLICHTVISQVVTRESTPHFLGAWIGFVLLAEEISEKRFENNRTCLLGKVPKNPI